MTSLSARALSDLPEARAGDDLAVLIVDALDGEPERSSRPLHDGQIVVIAHKVVSKAEGAVVTLASVTPGERAQELAAEQGKDPRAVQVVLDQSAEILRAANGVLMGALDLTNGANLVVNTAVSATTSAAAATTTARREPSTCNNCIASSVMAPI